MIFIGLVRGRFLSSKPCAAQLLWRNFRTIFLQLCLENRHEISPATTVDAAEEWLEGLENSRSP
ncbi:hypothetical protein [Campylobacter sp.]|uniref:hypothetical protein n=1 Tax=Campylobacter sp. TaxID=205 RepID=UPI002A660B9C|nr:hypothetical protein [Campylobacter sp.]MDD7703398.1 hypothetical protein [Campylobacteraceae bacterium]MDY2635785.1 hypothetical protein [Campylobacter sp.]